MKKLMILSLIIIAAFGGVAKIGESGFKWKSSSLLPNGKVVQACVGNNVTFPWAFDMTSPKEVVIQWSKTSKGNPDREKPLLLATYRRDNFFELRPERDLEFIPNAGIKLPNVTLSDTGSYTVEIFSFGHPNLYKQVAFLQVSDAFVTTSDEFHAFILPELVYNSTTRLWHVHLGCRPPIIQGQSALPVIWTNPSHRRAFSTSFKNNTFFLELPLPLEEGYYSCSLDRSFPAVKCLSTLLNTSRVATVSVKSVSTRLSYLERCVETLWKETADLNASLCHLTDIAQQIQTKDKKFCCEEFINLNQTTENIKSALQNLQIKNDNITSKIILLESITTTAQMKYDNMSAMVLSKFGNLTDEIQRKIGSMTALEQKKFDDITAMVQNISAVVDTNNDSITVMVQSKFDTITAMVQSMFDNFTDVIQRKIGSMTALEQKKFDDITAMVQNISAAVDTNNDSIIAMVQSKFDTITAMVQSKFDNFTDVIQRKIGSMTALEQKKFDDITAMVQNISAVVDTNNDSITAMVQSKFDTITAMVQSKFDNFTDVIQRKIGSMTALEQKKFDDITAMVQNISAVVDTNNDSITAMVQSKFDTITAMVQNISAVVDTNNDSITAMVQSKFDTITAMVQNISSVVDTNNDSITAMVQSKFDTITAMVQSMFDTITAMVQSKFDNFTDVIQRINGSMTALEQKKFDDITAMVQNISAVVDTNNDNIIAMVQSKFDTITAMVQSKFDNLTVVIQRKDGSITALEQKKFTDIAAMVQNISAVVDTNNDSITAMVQSKFDTITAIVQSKFDYVMAMVLRNNVNITAMVQRKFDNINAIVLQLQSGLTQLTNSDSVQKPATCVDVQKYDKVSGVHTLIINDNRSVKVYCDQSTDNGGWTVIQRRQDGSVDFYRNWEQYEIGFGDLNGEFWIGLANLYHLTKNKNSKLRVDLTDFDGSTAYAMYNTFNISGAQDKYRLNVGGYTGTAGDSLELHNKMQFSTFDSDNDPNTKNCAKNFHGAWWYYAGCHVSGLNSRYKSNGASGTDGINWKYWKSDWRSYKRVEMKIKQ